MHPHAAHLSRFWSKVTVGGPDECWPWHASLRETGYGQLWWDGQPARKAHRVAFFLVHGSWPENALHTCDNRRCCNPAHLYDGSIAENNQDMVARGRAWVQQPGAAARGERHAMAVLTEDDVLEIRRAYEAGEATQYDLAEQYGVHQFAIWSVVNGRTWRHVAVGPVAPPVRKRPGSTGERNASAKLTATAVQAIRASDEPGSVLARRYGVSHTMVIRIRRRLAWQHVP